MATLVDPNGGWFWPGILLGKDVNSETQQKDVISLQMLLQVGWMLPLLNFQMSVHLERGYPLRPFICLGFEDLLDKVSKVGQLPDRKSTRLNSSHL